MAEFKKRKTAGEDKTNNSPESQKTDEADDEFNESIYLSKTKRRLAFLDMLVEAAEVENSLTLDGIQEEVDTFMFAVNVKRKVGNLAWHRIVH